MNNASGDDATPSQPSEVTDGDGAAIAELAQILLKDSSLEQVMNRIVHLAKQSIRGADEVSVTLVTGDHADSAAWTGDTAITLDERQYEQGYGPCLDAAQANETMVVRDMTDEPRWPRYAPLALSAGIRSSLSVCLPVLQQTYGALNIYSNQTDAFDERSIALAHTFANYAAVALANASVYTSTAELANQMEQAMASRAVIEQAKGIIMRERHCTAEEAFAVLTKLSQDTNVKLREVAAMLVASTQSGQN